jgi:hypothetical protein
MENRMNQPTPESHVTSSLETKKKRSRWTFKWLRLSNVQVWLLLSSLVCFITAIVFAVMSPYPRIDENWVQHDNWFTRSEVNPDLRVPRIGSLSHVDFQSATQWWGFSTDKVFQTSDSGHTWTEVPLEWPDWSSAQPASTPIQAEPAATNVEVPAKPEDDPKASKASELNKGDAVPATKESPKASPKAYMCGVKAKQRNPNRDDVQIDEE